MVQSDTPPEETAQSAAPNIAQGAAKQSPASTPEIQTTGAQAPKPQPTEPPSAPEADLEINAFTIASEIANILEGTGEDNEALILPRLTVALPSPQPEESPESMDIEIASLEIPGEQNEEPGTVLSFTREEALALVVERCFGDSGYQMVRENLDGEPLSCHVSLMDGDTFILGGTIVCTGENEEFFLFECHWDDDPENPYHYSVHKTEGYVAWQGEVLGNEP